MLGVPRVGGNPPSVVQPSRGPRVRYLNVPGIDLTAGPSFTPQCRF
jgi:hypothetical protein